MEQLGAEARGRVRGTLAGDTTSLSLDSPVSGSDTAPCDAPRVGALAGLADGDGPNGDAPTLGRVNRLAIAVFVKGGRKEKISV